MERIFHVDFLSNQQASLLEKIGQMPKSHLYLYGGLVRDYLRYYFGEENVTEEKDVDIIAIVPDFNQAIDYLFSISKAMVPGIIKEKTIRVIGERGATADVSLLLPHQSIRRQANDFTINGFIADLRKLLSVGEAPIRAIWETSWEDLAEKRLRAPEPKMLTDFPFGALRGIRLYTQLGYSFFSETLQAYPRAAQIVKKEVPILLILREFGYAINLSLSRFLDGLNQTEFLDVFFPLLRHLEGVKRQDAADITEFEHIQAVCKGFDDLIHSPRRDNPFWEQWQERKKEIIPSLRRFSLGVSQYRNILAMIGYAILLHDIGKIWRREGHEFYSGRAVLDLTDKLSFFPNERFFIYYLVSNHMKMHRAVRGEEEDIQWFKSIPSEEVKWSLVILTLADLLGLPHPVPDDALLNALELLEL